MNKEVIGFCPICNEKLMATKLSCENCKLDLIGDFSLNKFSYLSKGEQNYVALFLQSEGSFKEVQEKLGITYQKAKLILADILVKLELKNESKEVEKMVSNVKPMEYLKITEKDHFIVKLIKEKLNKNGGQATIPLITQGKEARIWFANNGEGLECDKIPVINQLTWEVFKAAYNIAVAHDGELYKGYARTGKLGSEKLPINSLEGYIAYAVHGVAMGESAFSPGFIIAAVLDWVGIFANKRGSTLRLIGENVLVNSYDEALENAKTFIKGIDDSVIIQGKLNLFRHWYYFEEIDGFAPSKFIGYKDMDMKAYEVGFSNLDGRDTERVLRNMFQVAEECEKNVLITKLEKFLGNYGSQPNTAVQIHTK